MFMADELKPEKDSFLDQFLERLNSRWGPQTLSH